jgi:hypothetical protein
MTPARLTAWSDLDRGRYMANAVAQLNLHKQRAYFRARIDEDRPTRRVRDDEPDVKCLSRWDNGRFGAADRLPNWVPVLGDEENGWSTALVGDWNDERPHARRDLPAAGLDQLAARGAKGCQDQNQRRQTSRTDLPVGRRGSVELCPGGFAVVHARHALHRHVRLRVAAYRQRLLA